MRIREAVSLAALRSVAAEVPHGWWQGHTILIGDAARATTPQLASGAGMALEDGIVLELGRLEASGAPAAEQTAVDERSLNLLAQPI